MRREQTGGVGLRKAVVQKQHHALVLRGAHHPPGGLQHLVHARVAVGVVETAAGLLLVIAAQHLLPGVHLRQTHPYDGAPDEPVAHKVYALAEDAAHDGKAQQRLGRAGHELRQKLRAPGIVQTALLHKGGNVRPAGGKGFVHLLQIGVAGEKRQIVAGFALCQRRQRIGYGGHAGFPLAVAGGDARQAEQPQIFRREGAWQRHCPGIGTAQYIAVKGGRGQGGAEQRRTAPCRQTGVHKGRGV